MPPASPWTAHLAFGSLPSLCSHCLGFVPHPCHEAPGRSASAGPSSNSGLSAWEWQLCLRERTADRVRSTPVYPWLSVRGRSLIIHRPSTSPRVVRADGFAVMPTAVAASWGWCRVSSHSQLTPSPRLGDKGTAATEIADARFAPPVAWPVAARGVACRRGFGQLNAADVLRSRHVSTWRLV